MAEILRKLADVVDGETQGSSETEITNRPGASSDLHSAPEPQDQEDHDIINVKPMVPPLQQKLDLMKRLAGEEACEECGCSPCECDDHEDEMSIMKRNAGIAPAVIAIADEDEPFEG